MASKRTSTVEIPGEPAAPEATATPPAAPEADAAEANPLLPQVALQPASLADTASADQAKAAELSRQVAATSGLVGSDKAVDWSHLTNPAAIMAKLGGDPNAHLPNPEDVDWEKQPASADRVLTKQGWLLRR